MPVPEVSRRAAIAGAAAWGGAPDAGPRAFEGGQEAAAKEVLRRRLGPSADRVELTLRHEDGGSRPWYRARSEGRTLHIEGASGVALVRGAYASLRDAGAWSVSWEGDRVAFPERFEALAGARVETPFRRRAYLNPCTFGYTTPFWDWDRWEREIDWMALHGVDLPLALEGQEYVWRALWTDEGLTSADIARHFSGPVYCPWQRMGNIEGHLAPLSPGWIDKKRLLQRRILARMHALGMEPVAPAFAGYVPEAFARRHPAAQVHAMRPWEGFAPTYWLDPLDPLFARLSRRFLELYAAVYGAQRHLLADAFNETLPPVSGAAPGSLVSRQVPPPSGDAPDAPAKLERLRDYGRVLSGSVRRLRSDAVWVIQGWSFGSEAAFWTPEAVAAFFSDVPDDGLLVLDIGNDRYPDVWRKASAFGGKPWIYGYVHNYGGSHPAYGDLDRYAGDLLQLPADPDARALAGFGVFPEGLDGDSVVYERLFDLAWSADRGRPREDWMRTWLRARYGATSPALLSAWADIVAGVYRTPYWSARWWRGSAGAYLFFKRPRADARDYKDDPGDHARLIKGLRGLFALAGAHGGEPLFVHDLVRLTRHAASLRLDALLPQAILAYEAADLAAGDRLCARITALALSVDLLAGAENGGLAAWLAAARSYGADAGERRDHVLNARALITVWGGKGRLNDYASRAWQGLYRDFYLERWMRFLKARRAAAGGAFDEAEAVRSIVAFEGRWALDETIPSHERPVDPVAHAAAVLAEAERW